VLHFKHYQMIKLFLLFFYLILANFSYAQEVMTISCKIHSYEWKKTQIDLQKRRGKSGDREVIHKSESDFPTAFLFKVDSNGIIPLDAFSPVSPMYFQKNTAVTEINHSNSNYKWGVTQTRVTGNKDSIFISREGGKLIYISNSPRIAEEDVEVYTHLKLEGVCWELNPSTQQLQAITPIPPGDITSASWEFVGHEFLFRDDDILDNYDRDFYLAKNTVKTIDKQKYMFLYFNIKNVSSKSPQVLGKSYQSALIYGYPICGRNLFMPKEIKYFSSEDLKGNLMYTEQSEWKKYVNKNFIQLTHIAQEKRQGKERNLYTILCKKPLK